MSRTRCDQGHETVQTVKREFLYRKARHPSRNQPRSDADTQKRPTHGNEREMDFTFEQALQNAVDIATANKVPVIASHVTSRQTTKTAQRKGIIVRVRALDTLEHWALVDDVMSGMQMRLEAHGQILDTLIESLNRQAATTIEVSGKSIVSAVPSH